MLIHSVFILLILEFLHASSSLTISCVMPRLKHGRVRLKQRARIAKFDCLTKYQLVGNVYTYCRDGEWDVPFPVCVRPGCTVPSIMNGVRMSQFEDAWITYFCMPGFQLVGSQVIYCDGARWNASAPTCVDTVEGPKLSCDFENPDLCGWRQDELHDFDWRRLNGNTPSTFVYTGPSYDHTLGKGKTGYYMYIESTSRLENDTARFISPIYDTSYAKEGCFSFWYHMFGKTCGGLRVYQKPDSVDITTMRQPENRDKYILFEQWGNLGNFWFQSVTNLSDYSESFQIIIEGIRGSSYTSDIAIDDVSILQGENCTNAAMSAVTPSPPLDIPDTCVGRCSVYDPTAESPHMRCGCSIACFSDHNCCPDFFDACIFAPDSTMLDELSVNTEEAPQTQKLIQTTPQTTSSSTTTSTTTSTSTKTTTTTTPKPTTKPTTPKLTTRKITTKPPPKTTRILTTKTTKPTTVPTRKTTKVFTTLSSHGISRTIDNHNTYHELVEKAKKEQRIETKTLHREAAKSGSTWKIVLILGVILCAGGGVWLIYTGRSVRGRIAIARLRGRAQNDQEVRYLSADVDDD
ncbi:MAM and LDL-receptor class A domain-containing protein 2-like [Pieris brassicae]|uniref:MAM and LDL-receptor class A domain-containing protein 2-like n=1 Tax=Pieris brassicae TaxID=7116 RepID=UPI001E65EE11|nr:MAM and LDL-receptor class A domain-containing protein 2-like [Pieris brassicae]